MLLIKAVGWLQITLPLLKLKFYLIKVSLRDSKENGIRRAEGAGRDVRVEKVREVGGNLVVDCFLGWEGGFVVE